MKKSNTAKQQRGFFDLGISLLVLAIGGTVALSANHAQEKRAALQQQEVEIVTTMQTSPANDPGSLAVNSKEVLQ